MKPTIELTDKFVTFDEDYSEGKPRLVIGHSMDIPDDWVSDLKRDKIDANHEPIGNWLHFASIPTIFVEQMMAEGINFNRATAKEITRWLNQKGPRCLVTTTKRV